SLFAFISLQRKQIKTTKRKKTKVFHYLLTCFIIRPGRKTKQINKKEKGTTVQKIIYRIKKKKNSKNRLSFDFF
ncbi:hypothetical protein NXV47_14255, partial [Bacteroides uniformis]|nr:hypothetical protein [Bacteroides uniformis]